MTIEQSTACSDHEDVRVFVDEETNLEVVIAVHSTARGPAAGGCRLWSYPDREAQITEALRLSKAMSYKNALANLPWGGGKSVINRPAAQFDREALFKAFGRCVDAFEGRYITAEDVGTGPDDMLHAARETAHVTGLANAVAEVCGDPSPWTAQGVHNGMLAAIGKRPSDRLSGLRVAIQGVGNVGSALARSLAAAGASLVITDVDATRALAIAEELGADLVPPDQIYDVAADVFMPCALGGVLNLTTIPRLGVDLVIGAANNQLATDADADELKRRDIIYVPDYVINSGGIICCAAEHHKWSVAEVERRIERIGDLAGEILLEAIQTGSTPLAIANDHAEGLIGPIRRSKTA